MMKLLCGAFFLSSALIAPSPPGGIAWQTSLEAAMDLAARDGSVVFVAVNADDERTNDRMANEVLRDKSIDPLAESTVNLVASSNTHAKRRKSCPRFSGISCTQHENVADAVRRRVLRSSEPGAVIAPQHIWLGPTGDTLLSVPYGISIPEMEWCFITALRLVDPEADFECSSEARPPRRLIMGDVLDSAMAGEPWGTPPTKQETLELLGKLKRGGNPGDPEHARMIFRLTQADEPEARKFVLALLSASPGAKPAGGGGPDGDRPKQDRGDPRGDLLHWIGEASPLSYWEICAELLSSKDDLLRGGAAVALEQLAAPDSIKVVLSALGREKNPAIKKNLIRALGTAGGDNKRARRALLKHAADERNDLLHRNAIIALGSLAHDDDVDDRLHELLSDEHGQDQICAVLAMALTRNVDWLASLREKAREETLSDDLRQAVRVAIGVLEGGNLHTLRGTLTEVASDEIPRKRFFGELDRPQR